MKKPDYYLLRISKKDPEAAKLLELDSKLLISRFSIDLNKKWFAYAIGEGVGLLLNDIKAIEIGLQSLPTMGKGDLKMIAL